MNESNRRRARPRLRNNRSFKFESLEDRRLMTSGLQLVLDALPGSRGSNVRNLTEVGDSTYFTANDGADWRHIPSAGTTNKLIDPTSGQPIAGNDLTAFGGQIVYGDDGLQSFNSVSNSISQLSTIYSSSMTVVGDSIFFAADDGNAGEELWRDDAGGTTSVVAELNGTVGNPSDFGDAPQPYPTVASEGAPQHGRLDGFT